MSKLFSTKGRLDRQHYFFTTLIVVLASWALAFVLGFALGMAGMSPETASAIGFVVGVGAAVIQAFLVVRRLHDLDKSGAQYFLLWIPLYNLYFSVVLLSVKGSTGPNQYGEDPVTA